MFVAATITDKFLDLEPFRGKVPTLKKKKVFSPLFASLSLKVIVSLVFDCSKLQFDTLQLWSYQMHLLWKRQQMGNRRVVVSFDELSNFKTLSKRFRDSLGRISLWLSEEADLYITKFKSCMQTGLLLGLLSTTLYRLLHWRLEERDFCESLEADWTPKKFISFFPNFCFSGTIALLRKSQKTSVPLSLRELAALISFHVNSFKSFRGLFEKLKINLALSIYRLRSLVRERNRAPKNKRFHWPQWSWEEILFLHFVRRTREIALTF